MSTFDLGLRAPRMDYRAEARADEAAAAEQRRLDAAAAEQRRVLRQQAADERGRRLREERRADKAARRSERAEWRAEAFAPRSVYRTGTLALVIASGLASLPAQVLHFVRISKMLLPLPFALEGAAWVMAAGVAYADAKGAPACVRWLLRALVVAAAGFAASINYSYGLSLDLPPSDAHTAGLGLAAVTLLGPLLFEIRQWVSTLTPAEAGPEDRARRKHARRRRRHHRKVAKVANRLVSAAPFGTLPFEDAWARAWEIREGTDSLGMTPDLHRQAAESAAALDEARAEETESARQEAEDARQRADAARQEAETARQRAEETVTAARAELEEITAQRDALAEQVDRLRAETVTARQELDTARERAEGARQEEQAARQRAEGVVTAAQKDADTAHQAARQALERTEQAVRDQQDTLKTLTARTEDAQGRLDGLNAALEQVSDQVREAQLLRDRLRGDLADLSTDAPEGATDDEGPVFKSQAKQDGWQHYLTTLQDSGGQAEPSASELAERFGINPGNARNWLTDFRAARAAQLAAR